MVAETFPYLVVRIYHVYRGCAAVINNKICFLYPFFDFLKYLAAAFVIAVYTYSSGIKSACVFDNFVGSCVSLCNIFLNAPYPFKASAAFTQKIWSVKNDRLKKIIVGFLPYLKFPKCVLIILIPNQPIDESL